MDKEQIACTVERTFTLHFMDPGRFNVDFGTNRCKPIWKYKSTHAMWYVC